jgi:hypothetical protein
MNGAIFFFQNLTNLSFLLSLHNKVFHTEKLLVYTVGYIQFFLFFFDFF